MAAFALPFIQNAEQAILCLFFTGIAQILKKIAIYSICKPYLNLIEYYTFKIRFSTETS